MKFSLSWLNEHVKLNKTAAQISSDLTSLGLEVDNLENTSEKFESFIVCKITKVYKHPNADRLKICEVSYGSDTYKVVCGASNAVEGLKTVFAPNGSFIPGSNFKLEKKNIRGVIGDGMLCSEKELGLPENIDGIIELDNSYKTGNTFMQYMQTDFIFSIGLTPNRGDCASVRGIARDLSAKLDIKLIKRKCNKKLGTFKSNINWNLKELKNKFDCSQIYGRHFKIKNNLQSPDWLKEKIQSIGLKPISSLVDITNFILYDLGRPLHVFDLNKLNGDLRVVSLKDDEKFIGLDKKEYKLQKGDMVIKDNDKIVSLAGIMGGLNSCVDENTKEVFLEVAYFDPNKITQTGRRLEIVSDSRYRFERGIDPDGLLEGLEYSTHLISEICGGTFSNYIMEGKNINIKKEIIYELSSFEKLVGYRISSRKQKYLLSRLKFSIKKENENFLYISPPSWRHDVNTKNDIIEEILRLDGYKNIPESKLINQIENKKELFSSNKVIQINIRESLARLGLYEAITFSFISEKKVIPFNSINKSLKLENPISSELGIMRNSLLPNLLDIAARNFSRGIETTEIFEVGFTYEGSSSSQQKSKFAILLGGVVQKKNWHFPVRDFDFYDMKSILMALFLELEIKNIDFFRSKSDWLHPGISSDIFYKGTKIASFGAIHPSLKSLFKIKQPTIICEGSLKNINIIKKISAEKEPLSLSPFLPLKKDFAFIIKSGNKVQTIIEAIKSVDESISGITIFDIYKNEKTKDISVGVEVEFIQKKKVLDSNEISLLMEKIIKSVEEKSEAKLRIN